MKLVEKGGTGHVGDPAQVFEIDPAGVIFVDVGQYRRDLRNVDERARHGVGLRGSDNIGKVADEVHRLDAFFRLVENVGGLTQPIQFVNFGTKKDEFSRGDAGKDFQIALGAEPRFDVEQQRIAVNGAKFVSVGGKEFIRKYNMENVQVALFRIPVFDIRRDNEKIPAVDVKTVVFNVMLARALGDDVDLVKFMRMHPDGKIVVVKITEQHHLLFLFFGQKIFCVQGLGKRIDVIALKVIGGYHEDSLTRFYKKSNTFLENLPDAVYKAAWCR